MAKDVIWDLVCSFLTLASRTKTLLVPEIKADKSEPWPSPWDNRKCLNQNTNFNASDPVEVVYTPELMSRRAF